MEEPGHYVDRSDEGLSLIVKYPEGHGIEHSSDDGHEGLRQPVVSCGVMGGMRSPGIIFCFHAAQNRNIIYCLYWKYTLFFWLVYLKLSLDVTGKVVKMRAARNTNMHLPCPDILRR